ncbi:unnamed protein product [Notodromas monacha]|uniref:Uncharacterized protein n=1 Tax=Notodromas monacha TaxID=399045 RepID=A0A7R9GCC6_9CRUS|nr:unnamed protein product [Notodromas monacha]CAG0915959.1 unnamed protein product [Notodromas monacha]
MTPHLTINNGGRKWKPAKTVKMRIGGFANLNRILRSRHETEATIHFARHSTLSSIRQLLLQFQRRLRLSPRPDIGRRRRLGRGLGGRHETPARNGGLFVLVLRRVGGGIDGTGSFRVLRRCVHVVLEAHVILELVLASEALVANGANVRTFASVQQLVSNEVCGTTKSGSAFLANEWLLTYDAAGEFGLHMQTFESVIFNDVIVFMINTIIRVLGIRSTRSIFFYLHFELGSHVVGIVSIHRSFTFLRGVVERFI